MPRSSKAEAARTRSAVVSRAVDLASAAGLEAVSIGRLADELGLSRSGVIGPFGSKEELQLAAVQAASERFRAEVWDPVADRPPGLPRLVAIVDAWFSYLERDVFPGGCFLTAASLEFDDRPGAVRDAIASAWAHWLAVIEREAATAHQRGELSGDPWARQLAFQLHAYVMAGNWAKQLFGGSAHLAAGRAAAQQLLTQRG